MAEAYGHSDEAIVRSSLHKGGAYKKKDGLAAFERIMAEKAVWYKGDIPLKRCTCSLDRKHQV